VNARCRAVWIGRGDSAEHRAAYETLATHCDMVAVADQAAAIAALEPPPTVIVAAQSRPGQFSRRELAAIQARAPLARRVLVLGAWCEGEQRTGAPPPGWLRLPWQTAAQWLGDELDRHLRGEPGDWTLPATATGEERALAAASRPLPDRRRLVGVVASLAVTFQTVAAACNQCDSVAVWLHDDSGPHGGEFDVMVFDGGGLAEHDIDRLEQLRRAGRTEPVVVLADFPRAEHAAELAPMGVAAVLPRPLDLHDFAMAMEIAAGAE